MAFLWGHKKRARRSLSGWADKRASRELPATCIVVQLSPWRIRKMKRYFPPHPSNGFQRFFMQPDDEITVQGVVVNVTFDPRRIRKERKTRKS